MSVNEITQEMWNEVAEYRRLDYTGALGNDSLDSIVYRHWYIVSRLHELSLNENVKMAVMHSLARSGAVLERALKALADNGIAFNPCGDAVVEGAALVNITIDE